MPEFGIGIIAASHYLPTNVQSNEDLCELIPELTPEIIVSKTGIKRRYHVSPEETASSMALEACRSLIEKSSIKKEDIGLIVLASFSQDYLFPPLSAKIHLELNLSKECQIIDINTACAGMVTGLSIAAEKMQFNPSIKNALVIGVEILSRYTDKSDRDTSIFFSDGASAVMLGKVNSNYGYRNSAFRTDSSTYESVRMRGGGSTYPVNQPISDLKALFIEQNGLATWKQAVTNFPIVIQKLLSETDLEIKDIDFFIFHQANGFLIDYLMRKMKVPLDKTYTNVEEIGNTGSASIGIALSEAFTKGLIKHNSHLIIAGLGAGFNFGACLFKIQ
ncbi:MAG: ketoacyl-ACP synthase III [Bacteroidia bacterium]|nr:ketoacyl-ACP synthase III [Bacteroidia bacterium]